MNENKGSREEKIAKLTDGDDPIAVLTRTWVTLTDLTPVLTKSEKDEVKARVAMVLHLRDECPGCPDHDAWPRIFAKSQ